MLLENGVFVECFGLICLIIYDNEKDSRPRWDLLTRRSQIQGRRKGRRVVLDPDSAVDRLRQDRDSRLDSSFVNGFSAGCTTQTQDPLTVL